MNVCLVAFSSWKIAHRAFFCIRPAICHNAIPTQQSIVVAVAAAAARHELRLLLDIENEREEAELTELHLWEFSMKTWLIRKKVFCHIHFRKGPLAVSQPQR